ncbi:hypothetical protein M8C21_033315 [Ambrosia artemisiifolia]|uniref:Uncharacterized protein n=1 Tax=Ambrosia artemisiifolia TaxID=4212 RepID=A0AAD5BVN7_AMBAR|nr:hypothetical protein M8C21_033315 [Ambrosia artemisiifolia]
MFEYGDEPIMKKSSNNIVWLIWIQLLSMLLLLILLYYSTSTATASPSATASATNTRHNSKVRENEIKETRTRPSPSTSTSEVQRANKPDARQGAESSTTNERSSEHSHHPCHIFGLAKKAFLKCLGIDSTPDRHHEKNN